MRLNKKYFICHFWCFKNLIFTFWHYESMATHPDHEIWNDILNVNMSFSLDDYKVYYNLFTFNSYFLFFPLILLALEVASCHAVCDTEGGSWCLGTATNIAWEGVIHSELGITSDLLCTFITTFSEIPKENHADTMFFDKTKLCSNIRNT